MIQLPETEIRASRLNAFGHREAMTRATEKRCPFCQCPGKLSREHPFGKWARPHVEMDRERGVHRVTRALDPHGRVHIGRLERTRDGDPLRHQIKSACRDCNSGWMSLLQQRAAPVAIPFVQGAFPHLADGTRTTLAAWAVMVTMNLEYYDPPTVSVPQWQRSFLRESAYPPPNWYVGIARYCGEEFRSSFYHRALILYDGSQPPAALPDDDKAQSCIFALGQTLFHTFSVGGSARFAEIIGGDFGGYGDANGLRTIWPVPHGNLDAFNPGHNDFTARAVIDFFGQPLVITS